MNNHIDLYRRLLTEEEVQTLLTIRKQSRQMFYVGDLAERKLEENRTQQKGIPQFLILSAIGELVGIGGRRVEKLRRIATRFGEEVRHKYSELPMAYFETAYDFSEEDGLLLLEYAQDRFDNEEEWITTVDITRRFKFDVLGQVSAEQPPLPEPPRDEPVQIAVTCDLCGSKLSRQIYKICGTCYSNKGV